MENPKEFILDIIESFVSSFIILMVIYLFLAFPEVVSGASMEPTLFNRERILVERVTKHFSPYERGDILVFHPPNNDNIDYVKRLIGLPGDVVKVSECFVYITNAEGKFVLAETYLYDTKCTEGGFELKEGKSRRLNDDEFLVLGDNRGKSADSRTFGPISADRIVGKVIFKFWPISEISFL